MKTVNNLDDDLSKFKEEFHDLKRKFDTLGSNYGKLYEKLENLKIKCVKVLSKIEKERSIPMQSM